MSIKRHDKLIAQARHAACEVACAHGLPVESAELVSFASNVILRLQPINVVARVSGGAALVRSNTEGPKHEVEVCGFLADAGAPMVAPSKLLDPGPHEFDGLSVTFWEGLTSRELPLPEMAALDSLRRCCAALSSCPTALPYMRGYHETRHVFHGLWQNNRLDSIDPGKVVRRLAVIDEALEAIGGALSPRNVPLHGDAHLGNVIVTEQSSGLTCLWLDWDDVCVGPIEWDYACMAVSPRADEALLRNDVVFMTAIEDEIDPDFLDVMIDARILQREVWDAALKMLYRGDAAMPGLLRRGIGLARRKLGLG
jgi:hypothetical protein